MSNTVAFNSHNNYLLTASVPIMIYDVQTEYVRPVDPYCYHTSGKRDKSMFKGNYIAVTNLSCFDNNEHQPSDSTN